MKSLKRKLVLGVTLGALATATAFLGNACSGFNPFSGGGSSAGLCDEAGERYTVIPGELSESVSYGGQVLDNMVACTQLQNVSADTQAVYLDRESSLPSYNKPVEDITGPAMLGITDIAQNVCRDVWVQEQALPAADRNLYRFIDPAGNTPSQTDIENTLELMALSCWTGRRSTPEEKQIVVDAINNLIADGNTGAQGNERLGIAICTISLASLDGIRQ